MEVYLVAIMGFLSSLGSIMIALYKTRFLQEVNQ